ARVRSQYRLRGFVGSEPIKAEALQDAAAADYWTNAHVGGLRRLSTLSTCSSAIGFRPRGVSQAFLWMFIVPSDQTRLLPRRGWHPLMPLVCDRRSRSGIKC